MRWFPDSPQSARRMALRVLAVALVVLGPTYGFLFYATALPGPRVTSPPKTLSPDQEALKARLTQRVEGLVAIGPRNAAFATQLREGERWVEAELKALGVTPKRADAPTPEGDVWTNWVVDLPGEGPLAEDVLIVAAHYDTVTHTPGADDNATGVAAALELVRTLSRPDAPKTARTVRVIFFVNEEEPYFRTPHMGSRIYAKAAAKRGDRIAGVVALDMLGYFSDAPGSQRHHPIYRPFLPSTGHYITFASDLRSRPLVERAIAAFRARGTMPAEGLTAPVALAQVDRSDHWPFCEEGYQGLIITDTAAWRNRNYHRPTDTPDTLDMTRFTLLVVALENAVIALANDPDLAPPPVR